MGYTDFRKERACSSRGNSKMERMHTAFKETVHPLPRQIIHRDMHLSNVIFKDDKLEGFIDFEILENNVKYLIYVIAVQVY